jgi:hypothetical protein
VENSASPCCAESSLTDIQCISFQSCHPVSRGLDSSKDRPSQILKSLRSRPCPAFLQGPSPSPRSGSFGPGSTRFQRRPTSSPPSATKRLRLKGFFRRRSRLPECSCRSLPLASHHGPCGLSAVMSQHPPLVLLRQRPALCCPLRAAVSNVSCRCDSYSLPFAVRPSSGSMQFFSLDSNTVLR